MNDPEDILKKEFDLLVDDLKQRHEELGMTASGNWKKELTNNTVGLSAKITGLTYTKYLVEGTPPGKFPPIDAIEKWIEDKGISPIRNAISISSLAFLIARKISREGTEYFKQGGTDLIDSVITPERIQSIIDKVSAFYVNDFILNITNELKKIAA